MKNSQLFKSEAKKLVLLFLLIVAIFQIVFYKENLFVILKLVFSLFYIIILPGHLIMMFWADKISFKERIIIGTVTGLVIIGLASYYLGIIGLNVKHHIIMLPLIIMILSIFLHIRFSK